MNELDLTVLMKKECANKVPLRYIILAKMHITVYHLNLPSLRHEPQVFQCVLTFFSFDSQCSFIYFLYLSKVPQFYLKLNKKMQKQFLVKR